MDLEVIDNVTKAYEAVKFNGVSKSLIALCTFIAVLIVINKFVTAYKTCLLYTSDAADEL